MSNSSALQQDLAFQIQNSFISPRSFQPQDFSASQNTFFLSQLMNQQNSLQELQMMTNIGNSLSFPSQFISSGLPNLSHLLGSTDRRNASSMSLQTNNTNFPFNLSQLGLSEQQIPLAANNFKIQGDKEYQPFSSVNQFQFQDNNPLLSNTNQPLQLQLNLQQLQQSNQQSIQVESQDVRLHQFLSTPLLNNFKPNESNQIVVDKKETMPSERSHFQCNQLASSDLSASCDKTCDASCQQELQKTLSLLQEQQNTITPTMPSCSKHQSKKDVPLNFICKTQDCTQNGSLMCRVCVREHEQTHEIIEACQVLNQRKESIQQNLTTSCQYLDNIESFFGNNLKELERTKNRIEDLSETIRQLQRAYIMMKLNFTSDSNILCDSFKQLDCPAAFSEKQINEKMEFITRTGQRLENDKLGFKKLLRSIETIGDMVNNIQNNSTVVQETASNILGSLSKLLVGSEMKEIEKKHQEEKTLEHFSRLFHLIKGHAKKRDVINFLTWEPQTKELKYSKDIKDKHGEHFYVSFSLQLKNLENMENKDIDESFIGKIVSVVEEKAPEIQNKKNQERKKIDPNGKKRKYCRFNPRIEIDVQLNSNSYKNIKIE